jgi:hypothetical protein
MEMKSLNTGNKPLTTSDYCLPSNNSRGRLVNFFRQT